MHKLSAIELKAIRLSLGLTVAEASEECGVTKRTFQYWEAGERNIPADVVEAFSHYASVYSNVSIFMQDGVDAWNEVHTNPSTDDADEYTKLIKQRPRLTLPYFRTLDEFTKATGNPHVFSMRIYNTVVSWYAMVGKVKCLSEDAEIPSEFKSIWLWLKGGFDDTDDDDIDYSDIPESSADWSKAEFFNSDKDKRD